ncbi:MAG: hypothetical protein HYU88_11500 [Chloroflexi bacterium]|nr:hypothetical protein [Chloroflexota bacterium]
MLGQDLLFQQSLLARPPLRYVALGHIHKHQSLGVDIPMVYPGSMERIDFGEEREDKGYVIVRLSKTRLGEGREVDWEFRRTPARRFVTVEVTCYGDDPLAEVQRAVAAVDVRDAVARLMITARPEHEARLVDRELRALLREAHYVAGVRREIRHPERPRVAGLSVESWTTLQALEHYLRQRSTPPDRLAALLQRARTLVDEPVA